ncbi:MAG: TIGR02453 family protein [Paracoccaceae bacterium]
MAAVGEAGFAVLGELAEHQSKDWYHANKDRLKSDLRTPFAGVLHAVSERLADTGHPLRGGAATMFRQRRAPRNHPDKPPYKEHVAGMLTGSGARESLTGAVHLQLERDGGYAAAGFFRPKRAAMNRLRDAMIAERDRFLALARDLEGRGMAFADRSQLRGMPQGYAEHRDGNLAWYLRLRSLVIERPLAVGDWTSGRVVGRVADFVAETRGLAAFGREALGGG